VKHLLHLFHISSLYIGLSKTGGSFYMTQGSSDTPFSHTKGSRRVNIPITKIRPGLLSELLHSFAPSRGSCYLQGTSIVRCMAGHAQAITPTPASAPETSAKFHSTNEQTKTNADPPREASWLHTSLRAEPLQVEASLRCHRDNRKDDK